MNKIEDWKQVWQYKDGCYNNLFDKYVITNCLNNISKLIQISGTIRAISEDGISIKMFFEINKKGTYYLIGIWRRV